MAGTGISVTNVLKYSDLMSAVTQVSYDSVYTKSSMEKALMAVGISIGSRMISQNLPMINTGNTTVDGQQFKNELVVAVLAGFSAYMKRQNVPKSALSAVSVDLLAEKVFSVLTIEDKTIY